MKPKELRIRNACAEDVRSVWEWTNDPTTRAMSFRSDPIPWSDHCRWYAGRLEDVSSLLLIAEDAAGDPVGMARFGVEGDRAVVGVNLSPKRRGQGLAATVIALATDRLFELYPEVVAVDAFIKPENTASHRAFARAGYHPAEDAEVGGRVAHRLVKERI